MRALVPGRLPWFRAQRETLVLNKEALPRRTRQAEKTRRSQV